VLFGEEVGELAPFAPWLKEYDYATRSERSSISGKPITLTMDDYAPSARFLSLDEVNFGKKFSPIPLDDLKDIDSLARAAQERMAYTGNVVLGNSSHVEGSTSVYDSHYVLDSTMVSRSKYVAYSRWESEAEYCFGGFGTTSGSFTIKNSGSNLTRCLEVDSCESCSDLYFSHNCENVRDSMFCFNVKNLSHAIGNAELPAEQYKKVKASLVSQMADELEEKKDLRWDIFTIGARQGKK
jgi:hypothetical protein